MLGHREMLHFFYVDPEKCIRRKIVIQIAFEESMLLLTLDFGKAESTLNHHLVSSGHVPFTNVTRSGAVMAIE